MQNLLQFHQEVLPRYIYLPLKQRVAIARALVSNPAFILADEPTGNLDSYNTQAIMYLLKQLNDDGATVILITHDHDVASHSARQLMLKDGRVESDSGKCENYAK